MNYTDIKNAALAFANRSDSTVSNQIDNFILMAEARMNRLFKVREQSTKAVIPIVSGQLDYTLPADYRGMRTMRMATASGSYYNFSYMTPEEYVNRSQEPSQDFQNANIYYCILGNKLAIIPAQSDITASMEMFYYQKVPNLNSVNDTNWVSIEHPDMYVFGVQAQIAHFVKDYDLRDSLNNILAGLVDELNATDQDERWGGPPMQMTVG